MNRLNMVRTIKNFKKETPIILPDALEYKRENNCYNKLKPYTCVYQEVDGRLGSKSSLKFIC